MTELDLYSEIVAEDDAQRFEYSCSLDMPEHVRFLQSQCSLLEAEVEALNAHVSRLEKERLVLIATKDKIVDNFSRMGLACRREIEKLKSHIKILCAKYRIPEPKAVNKRNSGCDTQIDPANQNYYTDLVAYLHSDSPPINVNSGSDVASTNFISECDAITQTGSLKKDDIRSSKSSFRSYSLSPSSSSSMSSSSSSTQEQSSSHICLVNNEFTHDFTEPAVDDRQLVSHSLPVVSVNRKNLENYKHRDSFTRVHEKSCELKQNSTLSDCLLVNKQLHRSNKKSGNKYALVDNASKQLPIIDGCSLKYTRTTFGQSSDARCFHQKKKRKDNGINDVMNDPKEKTDTSEIRISSSRKVKEFSSPLNIKKCSSVGRSTVKDFLMVQYVLHPLSRLTHSTGPDSFNRNHVSEHLLIAVESAIRLSRDHHSVRRLHDAANSIHYNRYSKYCCRNYQTHDEKSHLKSFDYSREPERRAEEVGCTLYTKRLRFKGDSINTDVGSTSGDSDDSVFGSIKGNSQLTSKASSTPNTSIPNSSNTVSNISIRDYSAQEIVHASNEQITNSVSQFNQSSNYFSRNDLFSSIKKRDVNLVLPELLKITPYVSQYQECYASPISRSPLPNCQSEHYNHHNLFRSSNSATKYYKRRELSNRDLVSGQYNRSSVSPNQPRRRIYHSVKPPNDHDSPIRRSERERISFRNRQSRVLTPVQNGNSYQRIGINPQKTSSPRFNSTHHHRF
ncbi:hypothetical protein KSF78_0003211 [Schistosoma japonicum]|nr:hypothetical protein KSF78_0003211 [Schistosoma japonicum]